MDDKTQSEVAGFTAKTNDRSACHSSWKEWRVYHSSHREQTERMHSRGFKILSWETAVRLKHPLGHTRARTICLCNLLSLAVRWQLCPSIRPRWHYGMLLSTQAKQLIRLVSCWPPPPSLACMDLSGYRRTLHQLGGVSRLFWQPKGQIASFPNCIESRFHQWLSCQCVNGQIMTNLS